ncbi:hypothetical protein [Chitinophaga sp. sic0106]|uniref:hypothetical protein n=1 Tax=Chitinophaga sp. sic0106 TaxID=2854785 RepID=UPI001C491861|nr:hypothetical protein [Chitinophaga sp. sic0106]MBV7534110.1 hypothetical protein [Chitinophaga sp. sic0106]
MLYARSGLVLGFHGCKAPLAYDVVNLKQTLKKSQNDYDWLGHGVYFWEHNLSRAWEFAYKKWSKNASPGMVGVIGATIDLGNCFDLLDYGNALCLKKFHQMISGLGIMLPQNTSLDDNGIHLRRELDCTVLELFHKWNESNGLPPFDSVRHAFMEGPALYENSGFREKTHVQICIRNLHCIQGCFLPLKNEYLIDSRFEGLAASY